MHLDLCWIRNDTMTFEFWCAKAPAIAHLYDSERDSSGEARNLSNTE